MKDLLSKNKLRKTFSILCVGLVLGSLLSTAGRAAESTETKEQHDARMAWWRDAKFGLFIHWGLYAIPAGAWNGETDYGEWIWTRAKIPFSQYEQFAQQFNPVKFDAKAWVQAAKAAGVKYIVITSKHHDGFGMWPSALTDWCIKSTPFHRDPLQELYVECQKAGIRFCLYYSIKDWHHPDWGQRLAWNNEATGTPDMDRYVAYMKGQLTELVTRYHPGVLWFDGKDESPWTHERGVDMWNFMRGLDPKLIANTRIDKRPWRVGLSPEVSPVGDYVSREQQIPPAGFGPGVDWESCMTMNDHWGFNKADQNWKTPEILVRNLIDCASKGGNYLLNVGPTSEGLIPQPSLERLAIVGAWMKVNGEAIYGTGPTPFGAEAGKFSETEKDKKGQPMFIPSWEWRATTQPGKIYIHVFQWPAGKLELPVVKTEITKVYLLAGHKKLEWQQTASGVSISLPEKAPDAIASVICLEIKK